MVRSLSALILALVVAVTSQGMALARGQSMAVGEAVICAAGGLVAIAVDAQGRPTGPPHVCPDATLHATGAPVGAALAVRPDTRLHAVEPAAAPTPDLPRAALGPMSARGPPSVA